MTQQQIDDFKTNYRISQSIEISLQDISDQNSFSHNGKVYNIKEGKPEEIFTDDATFMYDGLERGIPVTNVFRIEDEDEIVTITKTPGGEVQTIMVFDKKSGDADFLESIVPGVLVSVEVEGRVLDVYGKIDLGLEDKLQNVMKKEREMSRNNVCSNRYRQIDLAVAADSSFCAKYGDSDTSMEYIFSLISMASTKYQQDGLCVKVKISHFEIYCDATTDIYKPHVDTGKSGCKEGNTEGVMAGFRQIWNTDRQNVRRDIAHLLVGSPLECFDSGACIRGCVYNAPGTTCVRDDSYSITEVTWTDNPGWRTVMVAHELGHNNGAVHYKDVGFVMYYIAGLAANGFNIESVNAMNLHLSRTSCVDAETAPYFPTTSPTPAPIAANIMFTPSPTAATKPTGGEECKDGLDVMLVRASHALQSLLRSSRSGY